MGTSIPRAQHVWEAILAAEHWSDLQELVEREGASLLPIPLMPRPRQDSRFDSSRILKRHRMALAVWMSANKLLAFLNRFDRGRCVTTTELGSQGLSFASDGELSPAQLIV